jgi:hypothetical protein
MLCLILRVILIGTHQLSCFKQQGQDWHVRRTWVENGLKMASATAPWVYFGFIKSIISRFGYWTISSTGLTDANGSAPKVTVSVRFRPAGQSIFRLHGFWSRAKHAWLQRHRLNSLRKYCLYHHLFVQVPLLGGPFTSVCYLFFLRAICMLDFILK